MISILDLFGFECFSKNRLEQLVVNTMNEQLQCHYNHRVFLWEMVSSFETSLLSPLSNVKPSLQQEQEEEEIPLERYHFYDNKQVIEQLMGKDDGLFFVLDEASRQLQDTNYVLGRIRERRSGNIHIQVVSQNEFTIAHYTGKLSYDVSEITEKNRDFVAPEMVETLRQSNHQTVKQMFTNRLTKGGALTIQAPEQPKKDRPQKKTTARSKWGAALLHSDQTTNLRVSFTFLLF